jgi:hypothetical protein
VMETSRFGRFLLSSTATTTSYIPFVVTLVSCAYTPSHLSGKATLNFS